MSDSVYFLPLGGSDEIGMNLNLYGYGPEEKRKWVIVDCGVTFGDLSTPGVDLIMPDPTFIEERANDLVGMVLTHAHEDHIGAIPHLIEDLDCPISATPFAASMIERSVVASRIADRRFFPPTVAQPDAPGAALAACLSLSAARVRRRGWRRPSGCRLGFA